MAIYTPKDIGGFGRLADVGFKKREEAREERRLTLAERSAGLRDELTGMQIKQTKSNLEQAMETSKVKSGLAEAMKNVPEGENSFSHAYKYLMGQGKPDLADKYMKSQSARVEQIYKMDKEAGIKVFNDTIGKTMGTTLEFHEDDKKYGPIHKATDNKTGKEVFIRKVGGGFEQVPGYSPISAKKEKSIKESIITDIMKETPGMTRGQAGLEAEKRLAASKRGKGIEISYDADGKPVINIGGSGKGMEKKTRGNLEADVIEMDSQLVKAERIIDQFEPEYLTIGGKAKGAYLNIKDKVFGELTADESKYVTDISTFRQNALESINAYIKSVTGAAMSNAEAERIRQAVADAGDGILAGDGPTKFLSKLKETIKKGKLAKARSILMLEKGITVGKDNVADIESKYNYKDVQNMLNIKANELGTAFELKYPSKSEADIRKMVKDEIKKGYGI